MMVLLRNVISNSYKNAVEYMNLFMFPSQILLTDVTDIKIDP